MAIKHNIGSLDKGQLDLMYSFMKLRKGGALKSDVRTLKENLDAIRQAMVQMTGGEQSCSTADSIPLSDIGTYINTAVVSALWLRTTGALDQLEDLLPEDNDNV